MHPHSKPLNDNCCALVGCAGFQIASDTCPVLWYIFLCVCPFLACLLCPCRQKQHCEANTDPLPANEDVLESKDHSHQLHKAALGWWSVLVFHKTTTWSALTDFVNLNAAQEVDKTNRFYHLFECASTQAFPLINMLKVFKSEKCHHGDLHQWWKLIL